MNNLEMLTDEAKVRQAYGDRFCEDLWKRGLEDAMYKGPSS